MEKEYNMTINRLPSKTWNWLRMNETQLEKIEIPAVGEAKVILPEKITTAENEESKLIMPMHRTAYRREL